MTAATRQALALRAAARQPPRAGHVQTPLRQLHPQGGVRGCDNAGQSNCGKDGTEHLISPVLAYQAGKFDGPNLSRAVRHLYETLHTSMPTRLR